MENDKIIEMIIEIRERVASIDTKVDHLCDGIKSTDARVTELEQRPVKRYDGAIMTFISTIIATTVSAVVAFFSAKN
jgi:tetrahydromethanopterin S-methyltransferase subunit B